LNWLAIKSIRPHFYVEMPAPDIHIRPAKETDLEAVNRVIHAAVMTWDLPARVKRLSLPGYYYNAADFDQLVMMVAEDHRHNIVGTAAWEPADARDTPAEHTALLLHGIYVDPSHHHQGIGRQLFRSAEEAVRKLGFDGLLVKAQKGASGFFISQGMDRLPVDDPSRDYENRFWKSAETLAESRLTPGL
jgi:predicted N-acetyltransferase YhbS